MKTLTFIFAALVFSGLTMGCQAPTTTGARASKRGNPPPTFIAGGRRNPEAPPVN